MSKETIKMKLTNNLEDLLELLVQKYPNRLPQNPNADISRLLGQQDVIKFVVELLEKIQVTNSKATK